jgi:peptidoglycan/xylan/chitin deacetylase (PgdA/CDA1 family)
MKLAKLMHLLSSVGWLTIDDTDLSADAPPVVDPGNLIQNASFVSGNPLAPQSWTQGGWGTNTSAFSYPVAGASDGTAAKVQMTSYTSGDVKWVHASVPVTVGHTYAYSDKYKSDVQTTLIVEMAHTNNTMTYENYAAVPASPSAWATSNNTFTIPSGVSSVRVFHLLPSVGALTIDDAVLRDVTASSTPQTTTVRVVTTVTNDNGGTNAPNDFNVSVSGASASPAFFAGSTGGTVVTVAPGVAYTVQTTPGLFYTAAYSPDCVGTLAVGASVVCTITLDDTQAPSGEESPNLIQNPSMETSDPSDATEPIHWDTGSWGTNAPEFTYTDAQSFASRETVRELSSGGKIVTIRMNSYTDGDAKWVFDSVPVIAGRTYLYQDAYMSDVPTELVVVFTHADGSVSYGSFVAVPASAPDTWKQSTATFTIPGGVTKATVYHLIARTGALSIDNTSLTEVLPAVPFDQGFVTLSFDDGLASQYTNAVPILNAAGMKGSFYVITHTAGMAVVNPALEIASQTSSTVPQGWLQSGSASASFSYPVAGQSGKGARVSSGVAGSNATWYFEPVEVFSDQGYRFADAYRSTAASDIVIQMTTAAGTLLYINSSGAAVSTKVPARTLPSSGGAWQTLSPLQFYVPPEVKTITVLHRLTGAGQLDIDTIVLDASPDFMTADQVMTMQTAGHEVGAHTRTHLDLTAIDHDQRVDQISGGRQDLLSVGITPANTLAYPYGAYNTDVQQTAGQAGFVGARTILPGFNGKNTDKFGLYARSVNADTTLAQVQSWVDQARANKQWLVLTFHAIKTDLGNDPYGATPTTMQGIVNYLSGNGVPVRTMTQGIGLMN